jgi:hypothetical protein
MYTGMQAQVQLQLTKELGLAPNPGARCFTDHVNHHPRPIVDEDSERNDCILAIGSSITSTLELLVFRH